MKPISRKNKIIMTVVILLVFSLIGFSIYIIGTSERVKVDSESYVIEVIDGDTIKMNTGETIRLLCVNTPEKEEEGYEEAKMFLESLVIYKEIRIEINDLNQKDKYGRTLAFVYVQNLGKSVFVNRLIIDSGFSDIYDYEGNGNCNKIIGVQTTN